MPWPLYFWEKILWYLLNSIVGGSRARPDVSGADKFNVDLTVYNLTRVFGCPARSLTTTLTATARSECLAVTKHIPNVECVCVCMCV